MNRNPKQNLQLTGFKYAKALANAGVAIFALASLAACGKSESKNTAQIPNEVLVSAPIVRDVKVVNSYSARIVASEDVEIRARVGGYLESVSYKRGAKVKKGETLFKIDDRPYAAALAAAEANVAAAQSHIGLCESNAKRARALFGRKAISKEAYQTRETELLVAKAKLLEAKAAEKNARLNLEYTNVVAPVSGRITESFADEGNLVAAHATKLARIVDDSSVKVYFELNSADAARYKSSGMLKAIDEGRGAEVEIVAKDGTASGKGKLSYRDNALGAGTASLIIRADIDNADGSLMAGAFGDIKVFEGVKKGALLLPEEIIGTDLTGRYVLTVDAENTVKQTPVKLGFLLGNLRVIEGGISPDTLVIIAGIQRARAGGKVSPKSAKIEDATQSK